jgi:hypothetical protein
MRIDQAGHDPLAGRVDNLDPFVLETEAGPQGADTPDAVALDDEGGARADSMAHTDNIQVSGSYHSVTNGIPNYDGFDRFRDANGQPLPGWEQELSSPR